MCRNAQQRGRVLPRYAVKHLVVYTLLFGVLMSAFVCLLAVRWSEVYNCSFCRWGYSVGWLLLVDNVLILTTYKISSMLRIEGRLEDLFGMFSLFLQWMWSNLELKHILWLPSTLFRSPTHPSSFAFHCRKPCSCLPRASLWIRRSHKMRYFVCVSQKSNTPHGPCTDRQPKNQQLL